MSNDFLRRTSLALLLAALATSLVACGDDDAPTADAGPTGPLYALMVQVYGPEDRTVYAVLSDTLDITSASIDLSESREFPGVANFAAVNGKLLISSGTAPEITEYTIGADHSWTEGKKVSFASYPLSDNANFFYQFLVDDTHAIMPYEGTRRILWNPSTMSIERDLDDTTLVPKEPGLVLEAGGNRNSVHYDGSVLQAFYYHDDDWYDFGDSSHVIVYDATTFAEKRVLDVPCPALSIATRDEDGNTYFSTWGMPTPSLHGDAAPMCIAKVGADGQTVETYDPRDWTEGRSLNNFRYVGSGKAFANVLHHEVLGVASPAELSIEELNDIWMTGPAWKLWLFDVNTHTGAPVEGIDVEIGSGAQLSVIDGRTFVFLPYADWTRTKGYELFPDGTAVEIFDTLGDIFKWIRVR